MDTTPIEALYARARKLRIPMRVVCEKSGVAAETLSRWRAGTMDPKMSTYRRVSDALTLMEEAR